MPNTFTPRSTSATRRRPSPLSRTSARGRGLLLLCFVVVATGLAIWAIMALQSRADTSREAEVQIGAARYALQNLQGAPFAADPASGGSPAFATQEIAADRATFASAWATLRDAPPEIRQATTELEILRPTIAAIFEIGAYGGGYNGPHAARINRLQDQLEGEVAVAAAFLQDANDVYARRAQQAQHDTSVGSVLAIVGLLLAFALVFGRAARARAAAERSRNEAQQLAAALGQSEAHLAEAQELAGVGSWEWSPDDGLTWSRELARLHEWRPSRDLHGANELLPAGPLRLPMRDAYAAVDPDDRAALRAAMDESWHTGQPLDTEYRLRGTHGLRVIHCQGRRVTDPSGRPMSMHGTAQDVTDRFRRVEAERANKAKDDFLSRMSHELRTPLNGILGFAQLLESEVHGEQPQSYLRHVMKAGRHLLALVNEILEISRIEAGVTTLSLEPVRLREVAHDAVALITPLAAEREITIEVMSPQGEIWANADIQRLKQVLLNLISNAVKYNHDGGRVGVLVARVGTERVQIAVSDDGPGIPEELQPRLFTPFDRLGADQTAVEGTGLGLLLSKAFVEGMGGTLTLHSATGRGTICTVELDWREPAGPAGDVASPAAAGGRDARALLYVEDNPANLELIRAIFDPRDDIELITAVEGRLGLELARQHHPACILLDLDLPDVSGETVLDQLLAEPLTRDIPVVVLSADVTEGRRRRLLDGGARRHLSKPIDITQLVGVVDEIMHPHDSARAA